MRIILDTNVLVSALIQHSYPYLILDSILANNYPQLCISQKLFAEYLEVLNRDKFSRYPDFHVRAQTVLTDIESRASIFEPGNLVNIIEDDADNRLLELAEISKADYIITGNTNDFNMQEYKGTKIISPKDFYELLNK